MEDIDKAFRAVSDSLLDYIREDTDTKYGPVAREERELKNLSKKVTSKIILLAGCRLTGMRQ